MVLLYQEKTKGGSERAHNGPKRVEKLFSGKIVIFVPKMFGLGSSPPPSPTMSTSFMSNENSELQSSCQQQQHLPDLDHGDVTVDGIIEEMVEWNSRQQAAMLECSSYEDETRPRPKTRQDNPRR